MTIPKRWAYIDGETLYVYMYMFYNILSQIKGLGVKHS